MTPEYSPTLRVISSTREKPFFSFLRLLPDDLQDALGQSQLVHQRSRQLKQGSMLAMMSPASATVLPRSMKGTVGVFL